MEWIARNSSGDGLMTLVDLLDVYPDDKLIGALTDCLFFFQTASSKDPSFVEIT
jgi:hypothetical protein